MFYWTVKTRWWHFCQNGKQDTTKTLHMVSHIELLSQQKRKYDSYKDWCNSHKWSWRRDHLENINGATNTHTLDWKEQENHSAISGSKAHTKKTDVEKMLKKHHIGEIILSFNIIKLSFNSIFSYFRQESKDVNSNTPWQFKSRNISNLNIFNQPV